MCYSDFNIMRMILVNDVQKTSGKYNQSQCHIQLTNHITQMTNHRVTVFNQANCHK